MRTSDDPLDGETVGSDGSKASIELAPEFPKPTVTCCKGESPNPSVSDEYNRGRIKATTEFAYEVTSYNKI